MTRNSRRTDELAALDAIRANEDIAKFRWLPQTHAKTPDLCLRLADGRLVYVEVTLAADESAEGLKGAARKMRPFRAEELGWHWTVQVVDDHPNERDERDELGRPLKDLVCAMVPVLARITAIGCSAQEMQLRANEAFDPMPHHPGLDSFDGPWGRWGRESSRETSFEDWALNVGLPNCGYWYVPDLEDSVLHELEPRHVRVTSEPVISENGAGGIHVVASPLEPGFRCSATDYLVPAIQQAVANKQKKDQMAGYPGEHWLAAAVMGNAAAQLEEACVGDEAGTSSDLSSVDHKGYDELWVIGCATDGERYAVARFGESGEQPALRTVRSSSAADTAA